MQNRIQQQNLDECAQWRADHVGLEQIKVRATHQGPHSIHPQAVRVAYRAALLHYWVLGCRFENMGERRFGTITHQSKHAQGY